MRTCGRAGRRTDGQTRNRFSNYELTLYTLTKHLKITEEINMETQRNSVAGTGGNGFMTLEYGTDGFNVIFRHKEQG